MEIIEIMNLDLKQGKEEDFKKNRGRYRSWEDSMRENKEENKQGGGLTDFTFCGGGTR